VTFEVDAWGDRAAAELKHADAVTACGLHRRMEKRLEKRLEKRPAIALQPGWWPEPWKASRAKQALERLRLPGLHLRMPAVESGVITENRRINHVREFGV
jgi:hypothetical protein